MANNLSWLPGLISQDESAVKFLNGTNLAFSGIETTLVDGPSLNVLHDFNVDSYASAHYIIHAECGSDQRETLNVSVVAKLGKASITVYGRINTGVNLIDVSADIADSILTVYATPAVSGLQNVKVTAFATLAETLIGSDSRATVYYFVEVANSKFQLNVGPYSTNTEAPELVFYKGLTYRFDQSDSSNAIDMFVVGTTADDTDDIQELGVTYYLNNIKVSKTQYLNMEAYMAATSRYVEVVVSDTYPELLYYFSATNNDFGNDITVTTLSESGSSGGSGSGGSGSGGGGPTSGADTALSNLESTAINVSLLPAVTGGIDLGSASKRWRDLYLTGNSIILGDATISSTGPVVNLPTGSTIGGTPIGSGGGGGGASALTDLTDVSISSPSVGQVLKYNGAGWSNASDETGSGGGGGGNAFATIEVAGQSSVIAETTNDTLTLVAGPNITLTTNAGSDSITISATSGGSGASGVSAGVANRLAYYASSGSVVQDTGNGLQWNGSFLQVLGTTYVTGQKNYMRFHWDTLSDLTIEAPPLQWRGMVAYAADTGKLYYSHAGLWNRVANYNELPTSANGFGRIQVDGQDTVEADASADTITFVAGAGMTITTNATNDIVTFTSSGGGGGGGITIEDAQDAAASLFTGGTHTGITFTYNDASNTINATVSATAGIYTDEQARDAAGSIFTNGSHTGITFTVNDAADSINAVVNFPTMYSNEDAQDAAASMITSATHTGISFVYNDGGNQLAATVSNEYIQDQAAALFSSGSHSGISFSYDDLNNRINATVSAVGSTTFNSLTDVTSAGLTVDEIAYQAITRLDVTNSGSSAYLFTQYTGNNPTLYALSGTTIAFKLLASGHPFKIQTGAGVDYNDGLVHVATDGTVTTGALAQAKSSGTLYWRIPAGTTGSYKYQCTIHGGMQGTITVKDISALA